MKLHSIFKLSLLAVVMFYSCQSENNSPTATMTSMNDIQVKAPEPKKEGKELTIHGDTRIDNYYWMKLSDEQKNAASLDGQTKEVVNYLNAENDYTKAKLKHTEAFQEKLYDEIVSRFKKDDSSVPYKDNGYYYITRYEEDGEYPIYSRKKEALEAEEEIMIDVNELAEDYAYFAAGGLSVSPNNKILAYGEDTLSRRIYTIKFKDLQTGEMLEDIIPNTTGRAVWANDNKTLFYSVKDDALRSYKIFRHTLGTNAADDIEIFHEEDETFGTFVYKTKSDKYIIIGSYQTLSSEFRILDANNPNGQFKMFQPRERNLEYSLAHFEDKFYIRTNLDAKNFRLMETSETKTTKENWKEVIGNRDDVLLEGMEIFKDYLVLSERKAGITNIRVRPWVGEEHYIEFQDEAYLAYTSTNPQFDTKILRLGYTSMTTPNSTYDYDMEARKLKLLKQTEVVGDFDPANYKSERKFVKARDGAEVPVSLVYRKGTKLDGTSPLLLYGYGSYGNSMDPYFSSVRLSLLDRGFVYAIAHIRGGEEMGRYWYEDGKLLNKKNTFTDFIDCGKYLVKEGYAAPDKLFAMGGSAGGLLMGAVVNMEPEMWRGVVAAVPFVDVITTMLDETIPLTTGEFDEWGNPKDKEYYDYIKSYSPYDNVEAKDYPNMLVTTGYHDSQVQYWEPAKWVAKLREMKTDNNTLLLKTNMDAGHGGASGRFSRFKETALEYAFFLDLVGINEGEIKN
jgi:oligopeptidase B